MGKKDKSVSSGGRTCTMHWRFGEVLISKAGTLFACPRVWFLNQGVGDFAPCCATVTRQSEASMRQDSQPYPFPFPHMLARNTKLQDGWSWIDWQQESVDLASRTRSSDADGGRTADIRYERQPDSFFQPMDFGSDPLPSPPVLELLCILLHDIGHLSHWQMLKPSERLETMGNRDGVGRRCGGVRFGTVLDT